MYTAALGTRHLKAPCSYLAMCLRSLCFLLMVQCHPALSAVNSDGGELFPYVPDSLKLDMTERVRAYRPIVKEWKNMRTRTSKDIRYDFVTDVVKVRGCTAFDSMSTQSTSYSTLQSMQSTHCTSAQYCMRSIELVCVRVLVCRPTRKTLPALATGSGTRSSCGTCVPPCIDTSNPSRCELL